MTSIVMVCTLHRFLCVYAGVSAGRVGIMLPAAFLARGSPVKSFPVFPRSSAPGNCIQPASESCAFWERYIVYVCLVCVWLKGQVLQPQVWGRGDFSLPFPHSKISSGDFSVLLPAFLLFSLRCIILCRYKSLTVGQILFLRFGY